MTKKFVLSEDEIIKHITDYLTNCDADDLARIAGDCFGGTCYLSNDEELIDQTYQMSGENYYEFEPDENYYDEFGPMVKEDKEDNSLENAENR